MTATTIKTPKRQVSDPVIDTSVSEETKRALAELREHAGRAALASRDIIVGSSELDMRIALVRGATL